MTLNQGAIGYLLTRRDSSVEHYDGTGQLLTETSPTGQTTNYGYDTNGRLATVTDAFGHALVFGYDANNHVSTVTDPAGNIINYDYDDTFPTPASPTPIGNLTRVRYPDGTAKLYHYEDTNNLHGLTGISYIESGITIRYATYAYDNTGKAIRTEHAQTDNGAPQEKFTLNYDTDTQTTVTDPVGMNEIMTFNTNLGVKNLISKVNQSDSKSVQQTFDPNNNLTCRKDEENRVTLYSYNSTNQRTGMTEGLTGNCANPASVAGVTRITSYQHLSATLDLPTAISSPSVAGGALTKTTTLQYTDTLHPNLPTQITQSGYTPSGTAVSRTVTLGYNSYGQVNSINGPRTDVSDITTLEYYECTTGGACGQLKKVANALGHITTYDLYDANGRLLQMTDPNGLRITYTYDARGRVKTVTQTPTSGSAALWQYSYTPWGDVSQVVDPDGVVLNYQYDAAHDLRFIIDAAGNYIHYKYDLKGNRIGEDVYDSGGNLMRTVGMAYDLRNHLSQINNAGNITQLVHDAVGNLLSESPNSDGVNRTTQHQYDALNRLFQTLDALNGVTAYASDTNDRLKQVTAPNNRNTQYQYDDLGNLLKEISPDRGTTTYTYDAVGHVLTAKDARNITTTYTYDALNRALSKTSSNSNTPGYAYVYDSCFKGQLCNVSRNGAGHLILGYDGLGRLNYQFDLSTIFYSTYAYTPGGRLTQITYPSGRTVDYQYDTLGRVSQVSTSANDATTTLASGLAYHPFGPLSGLTYGNGQSRTAGLDPAYRPTFRSDGTYLQNITAYDGADNFTERYAPNLQSFDYDPLSRLTAAAVNAGNLGYTYDANGNRQEETRDGAPTLYIYSPEGSNKLYQVGETDYRITGAGGYTTWTSGQYVLAYDGYGRLTSALSGAATYEYNVFDQRTKKTAGGVTTRFHYGPSGELLYETGGGGKAHVYLNGVPLARIDGVNIYYYHTDHLGTPQIMTNGAGATVWKANYEPFGWATVTVNTITNNLRIGNSYQDSETGLHYWNSRYYDPKTGRGTSPDRMGVAWHVQRYRANLGVPNQPPLEINPYVAFANNPLRWIDPTGLWSITAGGYIGVGGEVTFGSDAGNGFLTGRFGFGLGGGVSYDPNGGIPGPAPQDRSTGGAVLSCSAQANFNAGPLTGFLEAVAARNYSNRESDFYADRGFSISDSFRGINATGSVGGQFTIYSGRK